MRIVVFSILTLFIALCSGFSQEEIQNNSDFPELRGPYLGQKLPGLKPEVFAQGIVCTDEKEGCSVFLNNGRVFMYNIFKDGSTNLYEMEFVNSKWSKPRLSSLSSKYYDGDFTLSPDGETLLFSSKRPLKKGDRECEFSDIWMVKRTESGWEQPSPLGAPINTEHHEAYPTQTSDGTLYFFARDRGGFGKSDIFSSKYKNGKFLEPKNLGSEINSSEHEWDPFVAPDESYLLYCSTKRDGFGGDDIYVSFKNEDGTLTKGINLGDKINSSKSENRPSVTWDGKYLFYVSNKSGNRDIYWVDVKIIEELKPKELK